jgi:hypothetical protein
MHYNTIQNPFQGDNDEFVNMVVRTVSASVIFMSFRILFLSCYTERAAGCYGTAANRRE